MRKYLAGFLLIVIFFIPNSSKAAIKCSTDRHSAEAAISKDSIGIDETAQITIVSENEADEFQVEYQVSPKDYARVNNSGLVRALKDGDIKVNLTINYLNENNEINDTCKISIPLKITSNDSSLKSLNLEEYDISSLFQSDKYSYEIKLPYKYDKINIIAEANSDSAMVTGTGKRYLNEGINNYYVIVTASNDTSTTYKLSIIRDSANDDATLKDITIENFSLSPNFQSNIYKYSLNVDKDIDKITIKANPTYEYAKIRGTGTFSLATGTNTRYIIVTAENGNEEKYEIVINRNLGTSYLDDLKIKNYNLSPFFNSNIFTYNLTIDSNINSLDITPSANENAQIEIIGNEKLKEGENEILVKVTGEDKTTTTYKLIVNKLSKQKEQTIKKKNLQTKILFIIFVISIIVMFTLIIILIKRNLQRKYIVDLKKKKKSNKQKTK